MTSSKSASGEGWFKSSRSSDNANCVEVRFVGGAVDVRDTKDRTGPVLAFDGGSWAGFVAALKSGPAR
ncbi:DUF397 domain-containing protein [Micromonospora okii]|uniref:DUF397 domain-containing protein n=1 Tax=Micromonospora okii TaxID=1182970 RepID=UPI001E55CB51|nr:DUF397 domain-containing protein [Micromonospora okii]